MTKDIQLIKNLVAKNVSYLPNKSTPSGKRVSLVREFQDRLLVDLNNTNINGKKWAKETLTHGGKNQDRIDIYGTSPDNILSYKSKYSIINKVLEEDWVIEIDATRTDQIAKKLVSRLALVALSKKTFNYAALLYPRKGNSENDCLKYGLYANYLIKTINKNNNFYMIFVYPQDKENIKIYDFSQFSYKIYLGKKLMGEADTMTGATIIAISSYIETHKLKNYDELKEIFGKYILNTRGKSRYKKTDIISNDKKIIYTYTQWRNNYGSAENWPIFVNLCESLGINIETICKCL